MELLHARHSRAERFDNNRSRDREGSTPEELGEEGHVGAPQDDASHAIGKAETLPVVQGRYSGSLAQDIVQDAQGVGAHPEVILHEHVVVRPGLGCF